MSARKVFGRLKGVEVGGKVFQFELRKDGLRVHQRNRRLKSDITLGFDRLTNGGGFCYQSLTFALTEAGFEVRHGKKVRTVDWAVLSNWSRTQPELFPELAQV